MRYLAILSLLVSITFLSGCLEDLACDPGPYYADIKVRLTINDENPEVPITVFNGRFENRDTLFTDLVSESTVFYEMQANTYYTAAAQYTSGAKQIIAIDGKMMEVNDDDDSCPSASEITLRLNLAN